MPSRKRWIPRQQSLLRSRSRSRSRRSGLNGYIVTLININNSILPDCNCGAHFVAITAIRQSTENTGIQWSSAATPDTAASGGNSVPSAAERMMIAVRDVRSTVAVMFSVAGEVVTAATAIAATMYAAA